MVADLIGRLAAAVPALAGRVSGAASLADLLARDALPQATPAANVIPGALAGGATTTITGATTQAVERETVVLLTVRGGDPEGRRALESVEDLIETILRVVVGWAPDTGHVFTLRRVRLLNFRGGTFVYEIAFVRKDYLRIAA